MAEKQLIRQTALLLVGAAARITEENELIPFYQSLLPRLTSEIKHAGPTSRIIGFEHRFADGSRERILGLEVQHHELPPPAGMTAWTFGVSTLERHANDSGTLKTFTTPLQWQWQTENGGRIVGEFYLDDNAATAYRLTANAAIDMNAATNGNDNIILVDYDPSWPEAYRRMETWLRRTLPPELVGRIEHYGSTAIPGMLAKPVIDILLEVPSYPAASQTLLSVFNREEWEYWWYADHMIFIRRDNLGGPRTHHLHIAPSAHRLWEGIAFRDYLCRHPEDARRYADLKRELSNCCSTDRERYTDAKTELVRELTAKAHRSEIF